MAGLRGVPHYPRCHGTGARAGRQPEDHGHRVHVRPIRVKVATCSYPSQENTVANRFQNPDAEGIRRLLQEARSIAVVGLSPKVNRPSYQVAKAMQGFGYRIIPVRPAIDEVLGEPAYADLYALPSRPDIVDVFRAPEHVAEIVDACIALKVPVLWLQDGVINEPEALRAQQAGITVVMNRCIFRDYRQYLS